MSNWFAYDGHNIFTFDDTNIIVMKEEVVVVYQTLANAPITEALIDIKIRIKDDFDLNRLQSLYAFISDTYPDKKPQQKWESKLEFKPDGPITTTSGGQVFGYVFNSADKKQIFQAKLDGFTFNRLKPYDTWESFRNEAKRLWQFYSQLMAAEITRVAVRYINRFNIPLPIKDFNEYLVAAPIVPDILPQGVFSFLTRVVIVNPEINANAIITQALEQAKEPSSVPIVLDIDAFRYNREGIKEEEAWVLLEKLRDFKNDIFFSSITDKAKELFR